MILAGVSIIILITTIFAIVTHFMGYFWITIIILFITAILSMGSIILGVLIAPMEGYLMAKLRNSSLMLVTLVNGNIVLRNPAKKSVTVDDSNLGTFILNPLVVRSFYGVKCMLTHEELAVPPPLDVMILCNRLKKEGINTFKEFSDQVKNNATQVKYHDIDFTAVVGYINYVHPHYINVRIERIAAELAKQYRQTWQQILPWISIMMLALLFGAIAYVIISSAVSTPSAPNPSSFIP